MDTVFCACKSPPTHRCIKCEPPEYLCLNCIEAHLYKNPSDGLISLTIPTLPSPSTPCTKCSIQNSEFLQVFENSAIPICKRCKKCSRPEDSIFISINWKEIVNSYKDLREISSRKQVLQLVDQYIETKYSFNSFNLYIDEIKDAIIDAVTQVAETKKRIRTDWEAIKKLKNEAESEVLKAAPDTTTEAGKLVSSIMNNTKLSPNKCRPRFAASSELLAQVQNVFERVLLKPEKQEHFIYVFNAGRPTLTSINVEKMRKEEFIFDRNWMFDASWCELSSKDLFFCGGKGLNSSDVLIINPESLKISIRKSFAGRSGHGLIEHSNQVYSFGGNRGKLAERYSIDTDKWESLADLPFKITRASVCTVGERILMGGIDCNIIYAYCLDHNFYCELGISLMSFQTKNKILLSHQGWVYVLTGNKVFYCDLGAAGEWKKGEVADKDWWTYSKPVVYNNCAYFIKYFAKSLWRFDLRTLELREIVLSDIEYSS